MYTLEQLKVMVRNFRRVEYGDWEGLVIAHPCRSVSTEDERLFLQFNNTVNIDGKLQKMLGWGHPELIYELKHGNNNLFIDCTFSCVPSQFY